MTAHETALRNVLRMCQDTRQAYVEYRYSDCILQIHAIMAYVKRVLKIEGELL